MSADLLTRIRELSGNAVADAIQSEFGGARVYVPELPERAKPAPGVRYCIKGETGSAISLQETARIVAGHAINAESLSGKPGGATVEVEARGLGDAFMDVLRGQLAPLGIQVVGVLRIRDSSEGGAA